MWKMVIGVVIALAIIWLVREFRKALKCSNELDMLKEEERALDVKEEVMRQKEKIRKQKACLYANDKMGEIDDMLSKTVKLTENREEK